MSQSNQSGTDYKQYLKLGGIAFGVLVLLMFLWNSYIVVDSREYAVVQTPTGSLFVINQGPHLTYWGRTTKYKLSFQYEFSAPQYVKGASKDDPDNSIRMRFNDGGHAHFSGSVRITLPTDEATRLKLHTTYGSEKAIEDQLVHNTIYKAVAMTAPLLSSKESAAEKRNDLINWISDQAEHGVYKTTQEEVKQRDQLTNEEKVVTVVKYQKDSTGNFARQEASPLQTYNIGFSALSVLSLDYEADVEKQIKTQQDLAMQVQTAIAQAKQAEQQTITTQEQGKAAAAKAKWEQEAVKAQAVTEAEQQRDVAKLNADKEAFNKQAIILKGQGEAAYKAAVTQANNNFDAKIDAWKFAQEKWAAAFAAYGGNVVPLWQTGGVGASGNGATQFMELMTANAAKQLGLDVTPGGNAKK